MTTEPARHLAVDAARPGGCYRTCPCGWWHRYDVACPTGLSDALTWWDFVEGADQ